MENFNKRPINCPHCGEVVNYLNHKHHLYMYCDKEKTIKTLGDASNFPSTQNIGTFCEKCRNVVCKCIENKKAIDDFQEKVINAEYNINPEFADLFLDKSNSKCYQLSIEYAKSIDLKEGTREFVNAARDYRYGYLQALKKDKNN